MRLTCVNLRLLRRISNTRLSPDIYLSSTITTTYSTIEAILWCPLAWAPNDEDSEELENDWLPEDRLNPDELTWGVHYQATNEPNFTRRGGNHPTDVPLLWWKVGKWRPDPELDQLFRKIGRTPWGNGLEEHWEDEDHGDRLVDCGYFDYCAHEEVDKVGRIPPLK